jgi:hypothetical protein
VITRRILCRAAPPLHVHVDRQRREFVAPALAADRERTAFREDGHLPGRQRGDVKAEADVLAPTP